MSNLPAPNTQNPAPFLLFPSSGRAEVNDVRGERVREYAVALDLRVERRHLHVQQARGAALVAAGVHQGPADQVGLEAAHLVGEVDARARLEPFASLQRLDLLKQRERKLPESFYLDGRRVRARAFVRARRRLFVRLERVMPLFQHGFYNSLRARGGAVPAPAFSL